MWKEVHKMLEMVVGKLGENKKKPICLFEKIGTKIMSRSRVMLLDR